MEERKGLTGDQLGHRIKAFLTEVQQQALLVRAGSTLLPASPEGFEEQADEEVEEVEAGEIQRFVPCPVVPIVATDCGIARIAEATDGSTVVAARAATIVDHPRGGINYLLRSGPLRISGDARGRAALFASIGDQLGQADFYVEMRDGKVRRLKSGVAPDATRAGDRVRAWWEALARAVAVEAVRGGIVLLDGALTLRTRDCPDVFMRGLAARCRDNVNALVGISKRSTMLIGGRTAEAWLEGTEGACFRELTPLLEPERADRVMGIIYAVRFAPLGCVYRVDVLPPPEVDAVDAVNCLYASAILRHGYPAILSRSHGLSYFTGGDVTAMRASSCVVEQLVPRPRVPITAMFAPWGGRFK